MEIHFTGLDGYYEIYNACCIIHRRIDNNGKATYKKEYKNFNMIPHEKDKEAIYKLIFGEREFPKANIII